MEIAHHFADNLGAFAIRLVVRQAHFVHAEQDAAVHGLQAVSDVRQRPPNDYAHRVINVRTLHFVFDIDRRLVERELTIVHGLVGAALGGQ